MKSITAERTNIICYRNLCHEIISLIIWTYVSVRDYLNGQWLRSLFEKFADYATSQVYVFFSR